MRWNGDGKGRRRMTMAKGILGVALVLIFVEARAKAQTPPAPAQRSSVQTFYLTNLTQASDANEVTTALRNLLEPTVKSYFVRSQNAIVVSGPPEQLALAQKLLTDLDRTKKIYRITYTVTETDGGKRIGSQHFSVVAVSGGRTVLKQGSRVPIATGTSSAGSATQKTDVTYLDVGLNVDAELESYVDGVRLHTRMEQTNLAEERSGLGLQDPVIRQTLLEGTSTLTPGKPLMLGALDIPGSTRHMDVEVVVESLR